ncbi:HPr family phosphocarrier protein [Roseixanthobacter liquoris]|uniref:HPr family phosphocarrier protein n=1 Tax=Roseixanthobacter liquoris TaxID=3119921 RepID=UPI00372D7465
MPANDPSNDPQVNEACGAPAPAGALVRVLPIINKRGLHARASAKFVQTVERFNATVTVCRNGEAVGGNSIMGLMMLAAAPGTSVTVTAYGEEAVQVLEALQDLVADRFGEGE